MNADTGDVNENATQYIVDWILSNKDSFGEKAFGTCLGMIQNKNAYIFPSMLTQALTKAGYSSRKTLKYLADKGLIGVSVLKDGSTKNSVTKWFNNRNCRFVEFHLGDLAEEKDPLLEEEEIAEQMTDGRPYPMRKQISCRSISHRICDLVTKTMEQKKLCDWKSCDQNR